MFAANALDRPTPLTLLNMYHPGGATAEVDPETAWVAAGLAPEARVRPGLR